MNEESQVAIWCSGDVLKAFVLLLVLLSPVSAPIVGFLIFVGCILPWEDRCFLARPLIDFYLVFAILPFVRSGPLLAIVWLLSGFAIALALLVQMGRMTWEAITRRY